MPHLGNSVKFAFCFLKPRKSRHWHVSTDSGIWISCSEGRGNLVESPARTRKTRVLLGLFDRDSRLGYFISGQKVHIGLTGDSHEPSS
ncbi:hypothetical protein HDF13_000531 [Edaphobacter lichenicola]|uniref:Uncharacterized protein n=1 Tax=Tunturiibacter gelidiferens TaxID=3069689 RepID=A0ACC5NUF1_9BACT|nr:hypothetical protein [Edaphobacter lichenicola]